jgi:hypothetical protein
MYIVGRWGHAALIISLIVELNLSELWKCKFDTIETKENTIMYCMIAIKNIRIILKLTDYFNKSLR